MNCTILDVPKGPDKSVFGRTERKVKVDKLATAAKSVLLKKEHLILRILRQKKRLANVLGEHLKISGGNCFA